MESELTENKNIWDGHSGICHKDSDKELQNSKEGPAESIQSQLSNSPPRTVPLSSMFQQPKSLPGLVTEIVHTLTYH